MAQYIPSTVTTITSSRAKSSDRRRTDPLNGSRLRIQHKKILDRVTIHLIEKEWENELVDAIRLDRSHLKIICPFIKRTVIERLLTGKLKKVQVITRFNLADFAQGVSDASALRTLVQVNAEVRGISNLHAKLYIFGSKRAIITSANLTEAAFNRNNEFGLVTEDADVLAGCQDYFDNLWHLAGTDLQQDDADKWDRSITEYRLGGGRLAHAIDFPDYGTKVGVIEPFSIQMATAKNIAPQAIVKFMGNSKSRKPLSDVTLKEIEDGGCHWAVSYSKVRTPRHVEDDAVIFIGRFTSRPNDIRVFGKATGMKYVPGRDDATVADIKMRWWKSKYPRYIRVHQADFVDGSLSNGVSLYELMDSLKHDAFASTQRNKRIGTGNTKPRRAYLQRGDVELSTEGHAWLASRLQEAFETHGKVTQSELNNLDWPDPSTF